MAVESEEAIMKDELVLHGYLRIPAKVVGPYSNPLVILDWSTVRVVQSYRIREEPSMDRDYEVVYHLPNLPGSMAGYDRQLRRAIAKAQKLSVRGFSLGLGSGIHLGVISRKEAEELEETEIEAHTLEVY